MSVNTSNVKFGPMTSAVASGSFGTLNLGILDSGNITFEPTIIPTNDRAGYQPTGLSKCEIITKQTDPSMIASASLMKTDGVKLTITTVDGTIFTCGSGSGFNETRASYNVSRPFEPGEGQILAITIQREVTDENKFVNQS